MRHLTCALRLGTGPVLAAMVATVVLPAGAQEPAKPLQRSPSAYEELQTFSAVLSQIRVNYVDSVAYHDLVHAAIVGMLHVLDPHSYFMSRAEWEQKRAAADALRASVIADSATGQLSGLKGSGNFGAPHGSTATYEIDFELPA